MSNSRSVTLRGFARIVGDIPEAPSKMPKGTPPARFRRPLFAEGAAFENSRSLSGRHSLPAFALRTLYACVRVQSTDWTGRHTQERVLGVSS